MDFHNLNLLGKYAKEYGHSKIRHTGVSDTEHMICAFLYFHEDVSQDTIANALVLDKTTVAKALLSLEGKGYVSRMQNLDNRRKNVLSITESGKTAIADVITVYDDWLASVMSCLSEDEQDKFNEYCSRLLEAAKNNCKERIEKENV